MFDTPTHTKRYGQIFLFKSDVLLLRSVQYTAVLVVLVAGLECLQSCRVQWLITSHLSPLYKPEQPEMHSGLHTTVACTALCPHSPLPTGICYSGVSAQWFPSYLHVQFERWKWKYYDTLEYTLSNSWMVDIIYGQHYVFLCGETSWIFGIITMNLFYQFYK